MQEVIVELKKRPWEGGVQLKSWGFSAPGEDFILHSVDKLYSNVDWLMVVWVKDHYNPLPPL